MIKLWVLCFDTARVLCFITKEDIDIEQFLIAKNIKPGECHYMTTSADTQLETYS